MLCVERRQDVKVTEKVEKKKEKTKTNLTMKKM